MKEAHKLSVILVTFNSAQYIGACLSTLLKGTYAKDTLEIIVVDNASCDETVSVVHSKFPHIRCIVNKKNIGFAKANNIGINKSSGKYVLLLNPDTIIEKDTLLGIVSFMETHIDAGVATCKVLLPNGKLDDASHRGFPTPINAAFHFIGLGRLFPRSTLFNGYHLGYKSMDTVHEIDSCVGAFMLIRRTVGEIIGWLDEEYFWYGEDIDFCYRVKMKGWKVYFIPKYAITHFKGASSGIKKHMQFLASVSKTTKLKATNARFDVMEIFYRKHYSRVYPSWLTWIVLTGIFFKRKLSLLLLSHT